MKNKFVTAVLAFLFGLFGTHRFYLGQKGRGFLHLAAFFFGFIIVVDGDPTGAAFFIISAIIAFIDAILFAVMPQEEFDEKYNQTATRPLRNYQRAYQAKQPRQKTKRKPVIQKNQYKISGIDKYKDYDFDGAIIDFQKALRESPDDYSIHFNIACAYSHLENAKQCYFHLSRAVELGFTDFKKIQEHQGLAFLRIQDDFDTFVKNGYTFQQSLPKPEMTDNIVEQIKRLGELHEKGYLTEQEFLKEKQRILRH